MVQKGVDNAVVEGLGLGERERWRIRAEVERMDAQDKVDGVRNPLLGTLENLKAVRDVKKLTLTSREGFQFFRTEM